MNASEQKYYETHVRPHQNGPVLKLMFYLALENASHGKTLTLSYRELGERVGLDRHTLIHAVKRLCECQVHGASPILERLQKGRGRTSSSYTVHLPGLRVVDK